MLPAILFATLTSTQKEPETGRFFKYASCREYNIKDWCHGIAGLAVLKDSEIIKTDLLADVTLSSGLKILRADITGIGSHLSYSNTLGHFILVSPSSISIIDRETLKQRSSYTHEHGISALSFASDDHISAFRDGKGDIVIFDAKSGSVAAKMPKRDVSVSAVCAKAKLVALETYKNGNAADVVFEIWSYAGTPKLVQAYSDGLAKGQVSVGPGEGAFSDSGKFFCTTGRNGPGGVWSLSSKKKLFTPSVPKGSKINKIAFSSDEKMVAWSDGSAFLKTAKMPSGKVTQELEHYSSVDDFSFESGFLVSRDGGSKFSLWLMQ